MCITVVHKLDDGDTTMVAALQHLEVDALTIQ